MLNVKAAELYFERYGKKFNQLASECKGNEYLPRDSLEEMQNDRLMMLIAHAYESVPYYRNLFDSIGLQPSDINSKADLHKIPILTKDNIRENYPQLVSAKFRPSRLRTGNTSGTTGSPLNVAYDIQTCVAHHVVDWRQKSWGGMSIRDRYASLQGRMIVPERTKSPPFWRHNFVNNQLFMSSFHLKEDYLPSYVDALIRRGIRFLEGYPSTVYTLAAFLNSSDQTIPLQAVYTSSETLYSWQREVIEKAFVCKVFDAYGMAERVVYASECEHHTGRHLNDDYGITEFVDNDGIPVPRGETGAIVATSLHNFGFPLIRYRTNDVSALSLDDCPCGRTFPLMDTVTTKQEAIITLPDGRWISPSVLTHPFKPMSAVAASQIVQDDLYNVRVRIVRKADYTDEDESILRMGFRQRLGNDINIHIEYVNSVEKTDSGKFKWVVSNVIPTFKGAEQCTPKTNDNKPGLPTSDSKDAK